MNTLQQFMNRTTAWEYIIAFCFLALFVFFWWSLNREGRRHAAPAEDARSDGGDAGKAHLERRRALGRPARTLAILGASLCAAGLLAVLTVNWLGKVNALIAEPGPTPTASATTGTAAAERPADIPADHQGRTTCMACHASGAGPAFPATLNHDSFPDALAFCQDCHKGPAASGGQPTSPATTPLPTATTSATVTPTETITTTTTLTTTTVPAAGTAETTTTASAPETTTPAQGPAPLPASHQGRTTCKPCHASGIGPALPTAPDHTGFADSAAVCGMCHKGP